MIKKFVYLVIIGLLICCKTNDDIPDCSKVTCAFPSITINLVDNATKENIIIKNSITKENIIIRDASENLIEFTIIENSGSLYANKKDKAGKFEILINSEIIANLSYNTSTPNTNECCDSGDLINVFVEDKEFKVEDDVVTIYL